MRPSHAEDGFTLIELIVVTAIIVIALGTAGTFFLAGASPAVAAAGRDVSAALDEARRTAIAFDAATVVFTPATAGSGYRARVYARYPGDPGFAARSGPTYDSTVTISETQAPLGAPAFALSVDAHGTVTGYAKFALDAAAYEPLPCPASGAFALQLAYQHQQRTVTVPCSLALSAASPPALETPPAAYSPTPFPLATCPGGVACAIGAVLPAPVPTPAATPTAIAALPTAVPAPPATPTPCPNGFAGAAPSCTAEIIEEYSATADGASSHIAMLYADGSICNDDGCTLVGPVSAAWACPFGARGGSESNDGSNGPYEADTAFHGAVMSMEMAAGQDAAEDGGDGIVSSQDSYCIGFPSPAS